MAEKVFGIDISRWQGNFNFDKAVKEGVEFVIVKGGGGDDGLYVDRKFNENYNAAKQHKLPVGVYWFSKALTIAEAKKEAEYFYTNCLKGKQFELPVYIDVENKSQLAVGKRLLTDIIKAWCEYLEAKGFWVGIYSSLSYFNTYVYDNELTCYAHWVAQWSKECTYKNTSCLGMWQFGGETNAIRTNKVAGVVCDQDYMLIDYPSKIKAAGLNGFKKTTTKAYTGTFPNIKVTYYETNKKGKKVKKTRNYLQNGDKGTQVENLQQFLNWYGGYNLVVDGIFGEKTFAAVKAFQKATGLVVDGLFGKKSLAKAKAIKK